MACCEDVKDLLNMILAQLVSIDGRVKSVEASVATWTSRIAILEQKVAVVEGVVAPVFPYQNEIDPIIAYFLDQTRKSKTYRLVLLDRVVTSLRETGKNNRFITVSTLSDALGTWLLDCFLAFLAALPKELRIDPPTNGAGEPEFITVLTFGELGEEILIKEALLASQVNLDGGSSEHTGGTEAYGASVGSTGQGLASIIGAFNFGLAEGVAKGLKDIINKGFKIKLPKRDETDPKWDTDRAENFAKATLPSNISLAEIAEVTEAAHPVRIPKQILVTTNEVGIIEATNIPPGSQPFIVKKEGDLALITPLADPTAPPIIKLIQPDGSILYTNIVPQDKPFVTFIDEQGVYHASNLAAGDTPFNILLPSPDTIVFTNVPDEQFPFTFETDPFGTVIIKQKE